MLPDQQNSRRKKNDSCFGLMSPKHRILFRQIFCGCSLQKKLLIFKLLAVAGFSLMLSLIIYLGLKYFYRITICTRPECIIAANRLLEGMNISVDPCENFYEYVCGNWEHSHSTSNDANSWFIERSQVGNSKIKNILQEKYSVFDLKPVSQMKEFYKMCMNTSYLNSKGLQPLYDVLDLLELPRMLPQPGISHDFSLAKVLAMSQKLLNLDIFFQIATHFNVTSNTTYLIIGPVYPQISLLRQKKKPIKIRTVSADEFLKHQIKYMTDVMKELSPGTNIDEISLVAMRIVLIDTQLKLILETRKPIFKVQYSSLRKLDQFMFQGKQNRDFPFSWQDYASTLTRGFNVSLHMNDTIVVVNHEYFRGLGIDFLTFEPIDFQRYVWWKIIDDLALHTTDRIRHLKFIFYERVYDEILKYSRSYDCISLVKSSFPEAITHVMAKRNNFSKSVRKIESMLSRIKHCLKQMIRDSAWLDFLTKGANMKKVDNVDAFIGYPEESLNSTWLTERFANVDIIPDDFMSSLINIQSVPTARIMNFINGPYGYILENDSFIVDYSEVNGFYQRELNSMYILSGIIQYPFFVDGLESLNYGAVGSILGHELMHGFDREGMHYDWHGYPYRVRNDNMTEAFKKQAECFINQYQQYYVMDNKTIDGNRTLPENIADTEGIRLAFYAYEDYLAENAVQPVLPAFENFSQKQLFFISLANIYCIKENESYKKYMLDEVHSPHSSRIIGSLSNLPEFAKLWNCQPNVPMNPVDKCSLW